MTRLAGHALVEALIAQGVDTCFGVPGESYLAVLDGFHEHRDRIRFIACRQEGGAAFMAEAQGKLTGRPGICFVTRGPGATQRQHRPAHRVPGHHADDPLHRPGRRATQRDREAFQEVDYRADVRPRHARLREVGRRGARRRPPARVRRARLPHRDAGPARSGGAGAARGHADDADRRAGAAARRAGARLAGARGAGASCASCCRRPSARSSSPAAAAGTRRACAALQRFAERWQLPVGCAFRFQDLLRQPPSRTTPATSASASIRSSRRASREADLVIAIGPRLGEMTTGGYSAARGAAAARRSWCTCTPAPRSSAASTPADLLLQCVDGLRGAGARDARRRRAECRWTRLDARRRMPTTRPTSSPPPVAPLDMAEVVKTLAAARSRRTRSSPTAPATSAAGCTATTAIRAAHVGRTQLAPTSGAMGYGVPAARRRQPARSRSAPSINFAGDGDFLMTGQELATATGARRGQGRMLIVHRRRQRQLRHDPHAPGARVPGPGQRQRSRQPRLRRARAGLRLVARRRSTTTAAVRAGVPRRAGAPTSRPCCISCSTPT